MYCKDYLGKKQVASATPSAAMETAIPNFTIKSEGRFLQVLFMLVLTLAIAMGSQPALAQTALPPCTMSLIGTYTESTDDGVDQVIDVDKDGDGLIEICDLEGLNEIRYQLDGSGYRPSSSTMKITAGCPATGCKGYELSADLDFNDDKSYRSTANKITWTTSKGWQPIGTEASPFTAIFKANKHRISNLMIDRPSARNVALFGGIGSSARIEGIGLINVNVRGSWGIASLAGASRGVISSSYATGTIRGGDSAGGLVGDNHGRITNSYTNVSVSGDSFIGGIVGCNYRSGTVTNSYTVPRINSSKGSRGGILGNENGSVANSYWDMDVSDISNGAFGLGQTSTQLQSPTAATGIYSSWNANVWDFGTPKQYPALKYSDGTVIPDQPRERPEIPQIASPTSCGTTDIDQDDDGLIEICNLDGLRAIRYQLDGTGYKASVSAPKITEGCPTTGCKGYELSRDLDFNDDDSYSSTANKITWTTGAGWEPIGYLSLYQHNPFVATFDGNSHTISNLMINRSGPYALGLFSYVGRQSKIANVGLLNVNVILGSTAGGNNYAGGLAGYNYRASIINSYVTGSVSGTGYQVDVGGLVGFLEVGTITNSFVEGTISGGGFHTDVGGLVGQNLYGGRITNSYATGSVSGTGYRIDVGGLVGWNLSRGTITNSYAAGAISGPGFIGGLIGSGVSGGITNSYWDKQISGRTTVGGGIGKTTLELQEPTAATGIYSSWSTDVWDFGTSEQYPALKYRDGTMMPNQGRVQPEDAPKMLQIEIAGVPASAVDEGDSVTLTASSASSANAIPLLYSWSEIPSEGGDLLIQFTTQSSMTIEVPEDYVPASMNTADLTIMLIAMSDVGSPSTITSVVKRVSITIAKRNNGKIAALGAPSLNERELTAPPIDLSGDPDSGVSNIGYQWQSRERNQTTRTAWANVPAGTSEAYTIAENVIGTVQYRVIVSYTDGQGYGEEVISPAVVYESRYSLIEIMNLTSCGTTDIDQDDDGLIEICNLDGLNAMRYQLDGSGYRPSSSTLKITAGCPATGCKGYELSTDLDFNDNDSYSSTANKITWTTGKGWQPIGTEASPFNTIFKANGHSISNLMIDRPAARNVALFGGIGGSAIVEGIALINVNVRGSWGIASLAGVNRGVISSSYATGTIRGGDSAGGLVGDNHGQITNSYTNVSVSGGSWIGGIVGCNFSGGTVTNSYTVSRINSSSGSRGGILGNNSGSVANSYWDRDVNGIFAGGFGIGLTTEQLQSPIAAGSTPTDTYYGWSADVWDFGTAEQYPALKYSDGTVIPNQPRERPEIPQAEIAGLTSCGTTDIDQDDDGLIEICNLDGLNAIRYHLDGTGYRANQSALLITMGCRLDGGCTGYELSRDLDFNDDNSYSSTANKITWTTGEGWKPIGKSGRSGSFMAKFEGNGHTISNLMINRPGPSRVGLFGYVEKQSEIMNIGLLNINVVGSYGAGGLASVNKGSITNSYAAGSVTGTTYARVGGLVAINYGGTIASSYATVSVAGNGWTTDVGGLVGKNYGGSITNSYAMGSVSGNGLFADIGGLIGENHVGSITNSYATGSVAGSGWSFNIGGLVGQNNDTFTNSYWDKTTSGREKSAGGEGKTTIELQSPTAPGSTSTEIYYGWDAEVWYFGTSEQYPILKHRDGTIMPYQPRIWSGVEVAGVPTDVVNEGESVTLNAFPLSDEGDISLNYHWEQTSGKGLLLEPTTQSSITLEVPENYVSASADTVYLTIALTADSDLGTTARQVVITIAKQNNGRIETLGAPSLNKRKLTAPPIDLDGDPDGGVGDIGYQWQSMQSVQSTQTGWMDVPAGTNKRYTIAADYRGSIEYRVAVSYTDGQGYREEVISEAVVYEKEYSMTEIASIISCRTTDIDQDDDGLIEICDLEGLNAMRYQWDGSGYREDEMAAKITAGCGEGGCKGYELVRDLDFNNSDDYRDLDNKTAWTTGAGWEPMRLESVFEGNDHTIANLMIDREQAGHVGLFGVASGRNASINGVGLIDVDVKARISAGGLVGAMRNGVSISNSYATGDVAAEAKAGGLVGDCSYSAIADSHASGTVSIGYNSAGGLAGYLLVCDVSDSHALSVVKGFDRVGGLVGDNNGYSNGISNSYAIADVAGRGYYVGGLIGINSGSGSVMGSYAMGEVLGADTVGGLVGYNAARYTIKNSYSFAAVKGRNHVGGLVGNQVGEIINSYSVGSVIATGFRARSGGLVGLSQNSITDSYWDKTTSGKAQSAGSGEGKTTAQLQSVTTTTTEIYSSWDGEVWDFGTPQQYPALKRSDGTLLPGQRVGLLGLSVFASDEIPYMFNSEVFDYHLLIADGVDTIKLLPTATSSSAVEISIISDNGFSESVPSGSLSSEIALATTQTTLITVKVDFASQASRTYRLTISRAEQSALAQLVGMNEPFDYVFSRSALNDMQSYEVLNMPEWLEYKESESGLMFSGTPSSDYMGVDYMDGALEQMLELQINNGDGTIETIYVVLQIDSPTTGTVELMELPGGVLQLNDELSDDNGIVEKTHLWEHCPVGSDEFNELEGVDGMSYTLPGGEYSVPGTAYRVRTTVVDSLGQRSELTTQIELKPVIKLRIKVFLEGFLQ